MSDGPQFQFQSAAEFSMYIEKRAVELATTPLETVLQYCADNMIDPDEIAHMVSKSLKAKLETNFRDLNYLPKQAQLDV